MSTPRTAGATTAGPGSDRAPLCRPSGSAPDMAYLMLYCTGWTQRWRIAEGMEQ